MAELERLPLYPVSREHLDALTDDVGVMQHAIGPRRDPAHGYCTDDVARALQVDLLHRPVLGPDAVAASLARNVRFLSEAFDPSSGRFRNFRREGGSWLDGVASDDSQGRAMLALGETLAASDDGPTVEVATALFHAALPTAEGLTALRARSSVLLGCLAAMRGAPSKRIANGCRLLASQLRATFETASAAAWPWPEPRLTYENALPVRALIASGHELGAHRALDLGLGLLDWLIAEQTAPDGRLTPIGNEWWPRGGDRSRFDQQPIEATALLLAAGSAFEATANERYVTAMEQAYGWFLGRNDLGVAVAIPLRGACHDGLTPLGVNANQGAESTLMWLIALEHIRRSREGQPAAVPPAVERHRTSPIPEGPLAASA
jgi:hypothetical protein